MSQLGVSRLKSAFDDNEFERSAHDLLGDGASADLPRTRIQLSPGPLLGNNTPGPLRGGVGLYRTQSQTVIQDDSQFSSEDYDSNHDDDAMPERKGDLDQVTMRRKKLRRVDLETAATGENPNAKGKSKQVKSRFSLGRNGGELRVYNILGYEEAIALTCNNNTFV